MKQVDELENKLKLAVSENARLQKTVTDLEKWKVKLEKESEYTIITYCYANMEESKEAEGTKLG
jgi:hypothetical protein